MKHIDARSLSEDALQLLRTQAHNLRLENRSWNEVASLIGVHLTTIMKWSSKFHIGTDQFSDKQSDRRGRRFGEKRTLALVDELWLRDQIVKGNPAQMSLPFALWNRRAVQEVIKAKFGIDMPIRTVGEYLHRWGFTPQRPIKLAIEQRPELLSSWKQVTYPSIVKRAKAEGAEIYWADETAVRQDTAWVRGYAPAGQTPKIEHATRWKSITMISAVTNKGLVRFAVHDGAINTDLFIEFMNDLVHDAQRKVFLIVDNLRVHHSNRVKEWVSENKDRIELFFIPPYSPEANPDELLNRDLKTALRMQPAAKDASTLKQMAHDFMQILISTPERVKNYFHGRTVFYTLCPGK